MLRTLLVLLFVMLSMPALAYRDRSGPVRIEVINRQSARALPQYPYRGERWIAGQPGQPYAVRLTNRTGQRMLVVLSVDGVNAITGQSASFEQSGYVLGPWQSTEITGWRKSMREVAEFYFTDLPDSYASRTGRPFDVGVIGIAVFDEARAYPEPPPIARRDRIERDGRYDKRGTQAESAQAPQSQSKRHSEALADQAQQGLGTGHGQRQWSPTWRTEFERANHRPIQISQLRYDDPQGLAARGVIPEPYQRWAQRDRPQAFPGQFAADPWD